MPTHDELLDLLRRLRDHEFKIYELNCNEYGENAMLTQLALKEFCVLSDVIQLMTNDKYFQKIDAIFQDKPKASSPESCAVPDNQA